MPSGVNRLRNSKRQSARRVSAGPRTTMTMNKLAGHVNKLEKEKTAKKRMESRMSKRGEARRRAASSVKKAIKKAVNFVPDVVEGRFREEEAKNRRYRQQSRRYNRR